MTGVDLRSAASAHPTSVVVLTTSACGATLGTFTTVSLDPPLVSVALTPGSRTLRQVEREGRFGLSVLGHGQRGLARWFASPSRHEAVDQFESVPHVPGPCLGLPVISGAAAVLECSLSSTLAVGDHVLVVGEVVHAEAGDALPLVHLRRQVHEFFLIDGGG